MKLLVKSNSFFSFVVLITSHLWGLNALSHSLPHNSSFDKSFCMAWQSDWFEMVRYIIVSSVCESCSISCFGILSTLVNYENYNENISLLCKESYVFLTNTEVLIKTKGLG